MQNLLSKKFSSLGGKTYVDLKKDSMDLEGGFQTEMTGAGFDNAGNLNRFFEEVRELKDEMEKVSLLLSELQRANEESKTVTRAQAMKALRERMDKKVGEILKKVKFIKAKLEELDKANIANRRIPGCEQGTSTDRTRMSVTNGLRVTLKDLMQDFQQLRQTMMTEYRETIERRYFTVTGVQAEEATIDHMIDTGESETFLQKAVQEQGRGQIIDTIKEIQERHDAVKDLEKNLVELHQIFLDMSVLVESQGEQLNSIEAAVQHASSFVKTGTDNLQTAKKIQRSTRKWYCIAMIILLIVILVVVVPILVKVLPNSSDSNTSSTTPSTTPTATSPAAG
ncbi:hypothetical protein GOP47_0025731 [Adiantum capillus-veneris]|uniref:t-SNARE coiled-coil homology domain-containing protein n=1 Tax=Adiantum capillus-veneris TaxID=13818 RepID=A0A9D4U1G4_ADICA|nr:hypothetical protein GOP47_0025731 [Adiantum capillus-veneris]